MNKHNLAIFASGTGTNANAIMSHFSEHDGIRVRLVITNNPDAGVTQFAEQHQVDWIYISNSDQKDEDLVLGMLEEYGITEIILAGWLRLIPSFLTKAFHNAIVNIHPALLPKFGGKGMYGKHVHKAVKEAGESESGITIHLVNEKYDDGKVLAQHMVSISENDRVEHIERKVRQLELENYPHEIERWLKAH